MRLIAIKFLIVASVGATVGSLHAESELKTEATTDGECSTPGVFQHIFTIADITDCSTEAKYQQHHITDTTKNGIKKPDLTHNKLKAEDGGACWSCLSCSARRFSSSSTRTLKS